MSRPVGGGTRFGWLYSRGKYAPTMYMVEYTQDLQPAEHIIGSGQLPVAIGIRGLEVGSSLDPNVCTLENNQQLRCKNLCLINHTELEYTKFDRSGCHLQACSKNRVSVVKFVWFVLTSLECLMFASGVGGSTLYYFCQTFSAPSVTLLLSRYFALHVTSQ